VTRKEAFIVLNMVPHLGPVRLRRLLDIFDSPERVLSAKRSEFQGIDGLNQVLIDSLVSWQSVVDLAQELARVHEFGATVVTLEDANYPKGSLPAAGQSVQVRPDPASRTPSRSKNRGRTGARGQTKRKPVETFSPKEFQTFLGVVRPEWPVSIQRLRLLSAVIMDPC
jgi:hypothetical protein